MIRRVSDCERAIRWNEAAIAIRWPLALAAALAEPLVAPKDAMAPTLADAERPG